MARHILRTLLVTCALALAAAGCGRHIRPSYPIGLYSVPQVDLHVASDAGFTVVSGPATRQYLDRAASLGLKVLASPGTSAGPQFNPQLASNIIRSFDPHAALWAWYLSDEPDLNGIAPADVKAAHDALKRAGARKPTALVMFQGGEALHYANIADITMIDRYPVPWLPLANFPQHVRMARLALGQDKPLIAVVQAFDWTYYPELRPSEKDLRPPTRQELRCMVYAALARRATGIFFYCFDDGSWKMTDHPEVWNSVKEVVMEVNQRQALFQARHRWWPYVHEFPESSTGFNAALESSVVPALLEVNHPSPSLCPGEYLLAVNTTDQSLTYRITLPASDNGQVPVLGESRCAAAIDGWLEDKFGPFDVHIYGPLQRWVN